MNLEEISNHIKYSQNEASNYKLFCDILNELKKQDKNIFTMMEIGCEEGYWSALFKEIFKEKSKNLIIEPRLECWKKFGELYFKDKKNVYFYNNYISELIWADWGGPDDSLALRIKNEVNSISIEQILKNSNTEIIDILHMDTQGSEYFILKNIIDTGLINKINYLFIMTHNFDDIRYDNYIELITKSLIKYEFILNDSNYKDGADGLIILKIN